MNLRHIIIDKFRGTKIVESYNFLTKTVLTSELLNNLQREKLANFLILIKQLNPFYSSILKDFNNTKILLNPVNVLMHLPIVDKKFITKNIAKLFFPIKSRKYQAKRTGGSTGQPLKYYIDFNSISESWAYIYWCWNRYADYTLGDPYMTVAGNSLGNPIFNYKFKAYQFLQNNYFLNSSYITNNINVNTKKINKARLLYGYPSSIYILLKLNPSIFKHHKFKAVFTTSEQLTSNIRSFIESRLGIPVYDMYGANDGGAISCECSMHNGFHYNPLNCFIEVRKNEYELEELLLTSITSVTLPFVRYRVGDVASLAHVGCCSCDNPFPMILNLKGRSRDFIVLKNGFRVHGVLFNKIFSHFPEINRYRIIQSKDYCINFYLEVDKFEKWIQSNSRNNLERIINNYIDGNVFVLNELKHISSGIQKFQIIKSYVNNDL